MHEFVESAVSSSGLRYTQKESGSPFRGMGETLSCIKCGQHRLRRHGMFRRYLTALMFFCGDCKAPKEATVGKARKTAESADRSARCDDVTNLP